MPRQTPTYPRVLSKDEADRLGLVDGGPDTFWVNTKPYVYEWTDERDHHENEPEIRLFC